MYPYDISHKQGSQLNILYYMASFDGFRHFPCKFLVVHVSPTRTGDKQSPPAEPHAHIVDAALGHRVIITSVLGKRNSFFFRVAEHKRIQLIIKGKAVPLHAMEALGEEI
jgi:hypothetical protein